MYYCVAEFQDTFIGAGKDGGPFDIQLGWRGELGDDARRGGASIGAVGREDDGGFGFVVVSAEFDDFDFLWRRLVGFEARGFDFPEFATPFDAREKFVGFDVVDCEAL